MEKKRTLTGLKKREQIQKANRTMFLWVVAASAAVAVCVVLGQFLVRQMLFNQKIIDEKGKTNVVLQTNKETFETIRADVNKLVSSNSLTSLRVAEDDTALQVVIDALPTSDDRAALATSLQQVVLSRSGVTIESISVTDASAMFSSAADVGIDGAVEGLDSSTPQEIIFDVVIAGNYGQIGQAIRDMEHSIRPFSIERLQVEGSGTQLRASINAKTYYLPPKSMSIRTEALNP